MRFEILGPLRLVAGGEVSYISAPKMELLLAILLTRADQTVSSEQLIEQIWPADTPRRANATLHVYVSQLRKALARPQRPASPLVTEPAGYHMDTSAGEIDAREFHTLVDTGRRHCRAGRFSAAIDEFESALRLWRGPVFGHAIDSSVVSAYATFLEEERLECLEQLFEALLMAGRHREVIGRLYTLVAAHPLRESLYRLLMVALYRAERQSAALEVYRSAREKLNGEIGLEPCRSLRDLHQAILVGDESVGPHIVLPQAV